MRQRKRKKRRILVVDNVLVNDRHDVATRTLQLAVCVFVSGCVCVYGCACVRSCVRDQVHCAPVFARGVYECARNKHLWLLADGVFRV